MKPFRSALVLIAAVALSLTAQPGTTRASVRVPASSQHWRVTYLARATKATLSSVVATGPDNAWAVGVNKSDATVLVRWNGSRWRQVNMPVLSTFEGEEVAASAKDNVWIFGLNFNVNNAGALRFDGARWHSISMPGGFGTPETPVVLGQRNVWVSNGYGCTFNGKSMVCSSTLLHWNGKRWSSQEFKPVVAMTSISGHVWAVVLTHVDAGTLTGRLALYKLIRTRWQRVAFTSPTMEGAFVTITASSARDIWIVARPVHRSFDRYGVAHFNGKTWIRLRVAASVSAEAGPGPGTLADGRGGVWLGPSAHWTGRKWVNTTPLSGFPECFALDALARIPGRSAIWGAGSGNAKGCSGNLSMTAIYGSLRRSS